MSAFIQSLHGQRIIVKLRGAVVSGVLLDSTQNGGLILKDLEIVEDGRGRYSLKNDLEHFKNTVFIRSDNIIAIMVNKLNEAELDGR